MSTRTKEEELALDEKIARIQRKNEEILRRQKEIEEDKRMAEQQNAIVKLRPSTTNVSRERTPALKPSNRELRHEITDDFPLQEPPSIQRSSRGSFRGRGGERFRGQGDWKTNGGPPPDPKSFLYDDERDAPTKDNLNSDQKREPERGRREERDNRNDFRGGGREFQRGRRRGGMEYRGERGRRGGGGRRNEEEEWRAERLKIDEARIQRQRAADGKWRREWDNDKVLQEPLEETKHETRKLNPPHQEKWSPSSQHHGQFHTSPDQSMRHPSRGGVIARGGRGRGRLDPAELEMPLEKFQVEVLQGQTSPVLKLRHHSGGEMASPPSPHLPPLPSPPLDDFKLDPNRSVACVGNTVKISIPNTGAAQSTPKPQRPPHEARGRYKSQASYSSQSDDDSPRDRGHRGRRQRNQKFPKGQDKTNSGHKSPPGISAKTTLEALPVQNKPPLPPFRAEQKPVSESQEPVETRDGDESWEDVTTSGTESMGEDFSSVHSSPLRRTVVNTIIVSGKQNEALAAGPIQPLELSQDQALDEDMKNSYEEYLNQLEMNEFGKNIESVVGLEELPELQPQSNTSETLSFISLDTSDNILLNESELVDEEKSHSMTTFPGSGVEQVNVQTEEGITDEKTVQLAGEEGTSPAKEEHETPAGNVTSSSEDDKRENDNIEVEVEHKENGISEKSSTKHDASDDSAAAGESLQALSDRTDNLCITSQCSDSTTSSEVKVDEKVQSQVET